LNCKKLSFLFLICLLCIPQLVFTKVSKSSTKPSLDEDNLMQPTNDQVGFIEVGQFDDDGGSAEAVTLKNGIAYVANQVEGLEIINISQPNSPYKISNFKTAGTATEILFDNDIVYITQTTQIAIINVQDPTNPYLLSSITPGGVIQEVDKRDSVLYILSKYSGLYLYDVSVLFQPLFISHWDNDRIYTGISVTNKFVCLSTLSYGIEILDMTFLSSPILIGWWNETSSSPLGVYSIIQDNQKLAFLASFNDGLEIINYTLPQSPHKIGTFPGTAIYSVIVKDKIAYLCDFNFGLIVVNVTDPTEPVLLDSFETTGYAVDGDIESSIYVMADRSGGLKIFNVQDPTNIILESQFFDHGYAYQIDIKGDIAIIADRLGGLEFFNISIPWDPRKIGQYIKPEFSVLEADIKDDIAILSVFEAGIEFVNISDLENPVKIGNYDGSTDVKTCAVKDDLLFVGGLNATLEVLNISLLPTVSLVDEFIFPMEYPIIEELVIRNETLIVGYSEGYKLLNISDPNNIVEIASYESGLPVYDIKLENNLLYCSKGSSGLEILNVSNNVFQYISALNTPGQTREVIKDSNLLYLAEQSGGILVVNITDINNPVSIGGYSKKRCQGLKKYDQYLVTSSYDSGIVVLAFDSDSDTITDVDEIDLWGTDPYNSDTDGDLMPDNFEIYNQLNPLDSSDASEDPDQDGLSNLEEWAQYFFYDGYTDPHNPDTDADLMPDGYEVDNNLNPLLANGDEDYDKDYLTNYEEYLQGTDPLDKDTDDDDADDGIEVLHNTDPLNPKDNPTRRRIIRVFLSIPIAVVLVVVGVVYTIRISIKRIKRNKEREKRLAEAEDEVLLF
jgi:hypothetical protein